MRAGIELAQTEGIIPAIETAHTFAVLKYKKFETNDVVVINLSGHGDKELNTYSNYFKL
jgi:tryptophan synthase beta chain